MQHTTRPLAATPLEFWWQHARVPLAIFLPLAIVFATTMIDPTLERALFFDAAAGRFRGNGAWWATTFLHDGGRWVIRAVVAAVLVLVCATYFRPALRVWRRPGAYFALAAILIVGSVGLLKTITNVDCPWDLDLFGGHFPYVHLFAHRPDALRAARCFPAAHASSGYALMAFYFVFRETDRRLARYGLASGIALGVTFGIAQEARGAHFLSHDVWSAALAWLIALSTYVFVFRGRLWSSGSSRVN